MHKTCRESKGSGDRTLKKVLFQGVKDKSAPSRHRALLKIAVVSDIGLYIMRITPLPVWYAH